MSPEREKAIKSHYNKVLRDFKKKALKMALDNDYPYIEGLLECLLIYMDQDIKLCRADIKPNETKFFRMA